MLYQINDGTVSLGGNVILDHIDFEIRGTEKIAVTGANGAGKTTLLQVLSGELELDGDDKRMGPGITMSRRLTVGMLKQGVFTGDDRTVEEELLAACPCKDTFERERFEYEQEYDRIFTGFGFAKEDKEKLLSLGGQLGYLDTQMQERTLLLYLEQLELSISGLRGEIREKCRLSTALGVMGSLFLVIVMF